MTIGGVRERESSPRATINNSLLRDLYRNNDKKEFFFLENNLFFETFISKKKQKDRKYLVRLAGKWETEGGNGGGCCYANKERLGLRNGKSWWKTFSRRLVVVVAPELSKVLGWARLHGGDENLPETNISDDETREGGGKRDHRKEK